MTALSAARLTKSRNVKGGSPRYLMAASTTIYQGSMVMLNSSGLAVPAAAAASNKGVVGVARKSVTSAGSGSYYVEVDEGEFLFAGTTLAQSGTGGLVYAEDDQTVDETQGTNEPKAGLLVEYVSASSAWVRISAEIAAL